MNRMLFTGAVILATLAGFTSCTSDDESVSNEGRNIELTATTRAASDDLKDFYFQITRDALVYESQAQTVSNGNVVISPLSAAMTLSMMANGVDETSSKAITDYLGVSNLPALNELSKTLLEFLPTADKRTRLALANALWINNRYTLNADVNSLLQDNFGCQVSYGDFANNGAAVKNDIDKWCAKNTGNQITSYPTSENGLDGRAILLCLNAMNFNGKWAYEYFNKSNTAKGVFHGADGDANVDFMTSSYRNMIYYEDDNFQVAKLYFGNETYCLELWLPSESLTLTESIALLTKEVYDNLVNTGAWCDVRVEMPKFKMGYKVNMSDVFAASKAFDYSDGVNFTMFGKEDEGLLYYNQACAFEVDEEGAKAAAVTSAGGFEISPAPGQKYTVRLDRPFYFFIKETNTGACLLSGCVANL